MNPNNTNTLSGLSDEQASIGRDVPTDEEFLLQQADLLHARKEPSMDDLEDAAWDNLLGMFDFLDAVGMVAGARCGFKETPGGDYILSILDEEEVTEAV